MGIDWNKFKKNIVDKEMEEMEYDDETSIDGKKVKKNKYALFVSFACVLFAVLHFWLAYAGIIGIWQHRAMHTMLVLTIVFLAKPFKINETDSSIKKSVLSFINIVMMILALLLLYYTFKYHAEIYFRMGDSSWLDQAALVTILVLLIIATKRSIGWPMAIVTLVFLAYLLYGKYLPGSWGHPGYSLSRITDQLFISTNGIFGQAVGVASTDIILFVIFAAFLQASGAGNFVTNLALAIAGRSIGGPAKTAVVGSCFMGTMIGSPVANVAATGSFTIPMMKKLGYEKNFAGAVEATASSGGMIMPPVMGASVFLMAEYTNTPYLQICIYAALPAILYYVAVFCMVHLEAVKKNVPTLSPEECPDWRPVLKQGWHYVLSIGVLVYCLSLGLSPMRCAFFATLSLIVLSWFKKETRMGIKEIYKAFEIAGRQAASVSCACAAAGIVAGIITITGAGIKLSSGIVAISQGYLIIALILSMLACLLLGMGIVAASAYIIVATLAAPALVQMGVPVVAAHLFLYYFGMMANVTPPVALAAYTAAGISGGDPMKTGLIATKLASVGIIVPYMFVYNQSLMLIGEPLTIIQAAITSLIGVLVLSFVLQRYMYQTLSWLETAIGFVAALLMVYPGTLTDIIGFVLAVIVVISQYRKKKIAETALQN